MKALTKQLLLWYRKNRVLYPWRKTKRPYEIWLSEILLQQTRIPVVLNFYEKILRKYPNLKSLAGANDSEFVSLWSGIGYYGRAHNMLACAREILQKHRGKFPSDLASLLSLPGIGRYTAGALRNLCFDQLTPAIDGNIRRVLSRLLMTDSDLESGFQSVGIGAPAADFFQSLMELGERICLPKPACINCPVSKHCKARMAGKTGLFPRKQNKKPLEIFHWYLLVLKSNDSFYYLQNPSRPFLKSAWIFPDLLVREKMSSAASLKRQFYKRWGIRLKDFREEKVIAHSVTFRKLHAHVLVSNCFELNGSNGKWIRQIDLEQHPTSSISTKVLNSLLQNQEF
jgi:A/G-specific adenine glycosylase